MSWYRYWEWPGLGAGYSCAMVGIWDWEGGNEKLGANIYQEPPKEALGKPGRLTHPPLLGGSLWRDQPPISERQEPKDPVEHLVIPMIHRGFSSVSICQVMALI